MPEDERPQYIWMPRLLSCISVSLFILFIVQGIVGCVYFNDCPADPAITVFMFFSGFISFFWALSWCKNGCRILCYCLIITFCCFWIFATIRMYSIYEPDFNKNSKETDHYCNKTFYLFAFWCSNLTYILAAIHISCLISAFCNNQMEVYAISDEFRPLLWS